MYRRLIPCLLLPWEKFIFARYYTSLNTSSRSFPSSYRLLYLTSNFNSHFMREAIRRMRTQCDKTADKILRCFLETRLGTDFHYRLLFFSFNLFAFKNTHQYTHTHLVITKWKNAFLMKVVRSFLEKTGKTKFSRVALHF